MASYIGKIQVGQDLALMGSTLYGICATNKNEPLKIIDNTTEVGGSAISGSNFANTCVNNILLGTTIHIKFLNGNNEDSCKLKVGSTRAQGYDVIGDFKCSAGAIISFTFDENDHWVVNDQNTDTTYTFSSGTTSGAFQVTTAAGTTSISIYGLGTAAYTDTSIYATSSHTHNQYAPTANPTFTGTVIIPSVTSSSGENVAATVGFVNSAVNDILGAADAMVFKGTIGAAAANPTVTALPTSDYSAGWTYKVITAGTYANEVCEVGDLIIAIASVASGETGSEADWTVAQANMDGIVTATSGENGYLAKFTGSHEITKVAQLTSGTTKFLREDGTFSVPAYIPNTDLSVIQNILTTTNTGSYPILVSNYQVGNTTTSAASTSRIDSIYIDPATGTVHANAFDGSLDWSKLNGTTPIAGYNTLGLVQTTTSINVFDNYTPSPIDSNGTIYYQRYKSSGTANALTSLSLYYTDASTSHSNSVTNSYASAIDVGTVSAGVLYLKSLYYGTTSVSTGVIVDNT